MDFDLIIFDCDGVLIDSELLSNRSEVEFLKSFGIEFELSDYMTVLGYTGGSHIQPGHQAKLLDEGAIEVFSEMSQLSTWLGT